MMLSVVSPPATRALEARVVNVDRIEDAHAGLDGPAAVGRARSGAHAADVAVRADQPRHDDLAGETSTFSAPSGMVTSAAGPTAVILPFSITSVPVVDLVAFDRDELGADEGPGHILGSRPLA